MMVTACRLAETKFRRGQKKNRLQRCVNSLREFYRAWRRPKKIYTLVGRRLFALSRFAIENKVLNIRQQAALYLSNSNNLRASLPACFVARINGKRTLVALHYNEDVPLCDERGLNEDGWTVVGGLSLIFVAGRLRGAEGEVFSIPSDVHEFWIADISRLAPNSEAKLFRFKERDLFLAAPRLDFLAKYAALTLLYSDACKKLGIDDGGGHGDDAPPGDSGGLFEVPPAKKTG